MATIADKGGHMNRRRFIQLAGISTAGVWLAACTAATPAQQPAQAGDSSAAAGGDAEKIDIEYMMFDAELTPPEIEQFQTENPGITITRVEPDATKYFASLAAGTPPDLYRLQAPQFPLLLARKIPLNLQPYIDVSEAIKVEDLSSANNYYRSGGGALDIGTGDVYGMVKDWSPDMTVWVNLDQVAEVGLPEPSLTEPMSYEDIRAYGEALTKFEGDRSVRRGFDFNLPWVDRIWMVWLESIGESLFTEDFTKIDIVENEAAREAIQYHYDLAADKICSSPINPSPAWPGQDFAVAELAVVQYGFWFSGGLTLWASDEIKQKIEDGRMVMLPSPTWKGERRGPTITATGTTATAATEHPDETYKVFEWYNALEPAKNRAASGWGVPALKSMYADIPREGTYRSLVWSVLEKEMEFAETPVRFNPYLQGGEPGVVASLYTQFYEQVLNGEITFDEMLVKLEEESNIAIQDGIDQIGG